MLQIYHSRKQGEEPARNPKPFERECQRIKTTLPGLSKCECRTPTSSTQILRFRSLIWQQSRKADAYVPKLLISRTSLAGGRRSISKSRDVRRRPEKVEWQIGPLKGGLNKLSINTPSNAAHIYLSYVIPSKKNVRSIAALALLTSRGLLGVG